MRELLIRIRRHLFESRGAVSFLVVVSLVGLFSYRGQDVIALLAAATSSIQNDSTVIFFSPSNNNSIRVGEVLAVDVNVNTATFINAVGVTILFPQDLVEVVGISKEKSFLDLWTEETKISEESGEVHFSGGTLREGGLGGVGTALTVTLRAKKSGDVVLSFSDVEIFKHDGLGETLPITQRALTFSIIDAPSPASAAPRNVAVEIQNSHPADFNENGPASLLDMSILTLHLFGPYSPRYDLNRDGKLNLSDLSVFFTFMKVPNP